MSQRPAVLVVVVTWEKRRYVVDLLSSLERLDYPRGRCDVVVVDNASTDGTAEAIQARWPRLRVLRNTENLGGSGGFNTGLAWALRQPADRYDYLWLLDDDVVVHPRALAALVEVLESDPGAGVAGSTMLQLDCPWRINEAGAAFDRRNGRLALRRHGEEIDAWRGRDVAQLLRLGDPGPVVARGDPGPTQVDYVAAASLLVRTGIVRRVGLWRDYFIHFDDVEWCLRIQQAGSRILVTPRSTVWHLSAARKVPSWVLYYDNRNMLFTLRAAGATRRVLCRARRRVLLKALYYALAGKQPHAALHLLAVDDFAAGRSGRRDLDMPWDPRPLAEVARLLDDPGLRSVAVSARAARAAPALGALLRDLCASRPDLRVTTVGGAARGTDASADARAPARKSVGAAWLGRLRTGRLDLVFEDERRPEPATTWLGRRNAFVHDDRFVLAPGPSVSGVLRIGLGALRRLARCRPAPRT